MAFNKDEYWKNRKDGKRGQGQEPTSKIVDDPDRKTGSHMVQIGTSLSFVNREQARRQARVRNRFYAGKDDNQGKPYTAKGVKHTNGKKPFVPSEDPTLTNKQRFNKRRNLRKLNKLAEQDAQE